MSNQAPPNFGYPGSTPQFPNYQPQQQFQNYPPGANMQPQQQFQNYPPGANMQPQQFQNFPPGPVPNMPQQQYQNFYQTQQGIGGGYQNFGSGNPSSSGFPTPSQYPIPAVSPPAAGFPIPDQYPNPSVCPPGLGDVPAQGLQPNVCPTAPDLSGVQPVPGYEGLTFEQTILTPPTLPEWQPDQAEDKPIQNLPRFTEEEVQDAVIQYASEHCCYGSAPAKDMQIREMEMISGFHYKLDTFTEKRESSWVFEPYNGQPIDGPQNGAPPSPWDVMAIPKNYFVNSTVKIEVPHTAFTRPCHTCVGNGRIRCEKCFGNGRMQCHWCKGKGRTYRFDKEENCTTCNTTGFERCFKCTGTGQVKCKTCDARGNLKGFVQLVVTWTNHADEYISEISCMPKELVREVSGQNAYEEENPRVFPIVQGAEEAVCKASSNLIKKHASAFNNERILKQRQNLRIVPISQVKFEWKDKIDTFCVYGFEHKIYFKEYPQTCCCTLI